MSAAFQAAIAFVLSEEGGFTDDPGDPGNWTGGAVGVGQCSGTNMGISAASYPGLDIKSLTAVQAETIYAEDYWTPIQGDALPPALALLVFDAAVNSGVAQASIWLQVVAGAATDGVIGPATLASVRGCRTPLPQLCAEVLGQRIAALGSDPDWNVFGLGWANRCAAAAFQAATLL